MNRALKASATLPEKTDRDLNVSGQPEYLLTAEAATLLRFNTPHLFHKWAQRNRVPVLHRGRTLLYERRVLVAFLEGRGWTKRHAAHSTAPSGARHHTDIENRRQA